MKRSLFAIAASLLAFGDDPWFGFIGLAFAALLAVKWAATTFGIQIGATSVAVLLFVALNRFRQALNDQTGTTAQPGSPGDRSCTYLPDAVTRHEPMPSATATR